MRLSITLILYLFAFHPRLVCDDKIFHTMQLGIEQQNCVCNGFDSDSV